MDQAEHKKILIIMNYVSNFFDFRISSILGYQGFSSLTVGAILLGVYAGMAGLGLPGLGDWELIGYGGWPWSTVWFLPFSNKLHICKEQFLCWNCCYSTCSESLAGCCVAGLHLCCGVQLCGLVCPAGVVECGCGGDADAVSACRSGTYEPVLANPSDGVTVASVVRAGSCYGWTGDGVVCVAAGRQGNYSNIVHSIILMWVLQCINLLIFLVRVVTRCLVWWTGVVMLYPALFFVHNVHHRPVIPGEGWQARCSNLNLDFHLIVTGGNYLLAGRPEEECMSRRSKCRIWGD